jgi:hypothetical protein
VTEFATQHSPAKPSVNYSRQLNAGGFTIGTWLHVNRATVQVRDCNIMSYRHRFALFGNESGQLALDRITNRIPMCGVETLQHQLLNVQLN